MTNSSLVAIVIDVRLYQPKKIGEMMTRKDYEMIAKVISQTKEFYEKDIPYNYMVSQVQLSGSISSRLVDYLSDALKEENPRFNPERFREACGF